MGELKSFFKQISMAMKSYLNNIENRRRLKNESLRNELKNEALRLGRFLRNSGFKFKRLYLFGSVVKEDTPLSPWSDIDLVIEGLPQDLYYKAYGLLIRTAKFYIDFKPFEELNEELKARLKREGVVIYEAR